MTIDEERETGQWIIDALLRLLERRDYSSITIQSIADEAKISRRTFYRYFSSKDAVLDSSVHLYMMRLGAYLKQKLSGRPEDISFWYFSYWEQNIDFLLTMQKAGLIRILSEHFEQEVHEIAGLFRHGPQKDEGQSASEYYEKYKFAFGFRMAGYWRVTELWIQENPRRSAGEMSRIINQLLWG